MDIDYIYVDTETTKLLNKLKELTSFPYLSGFTVGDGIFVPVWHSEIYSVLMKKCEDMLRKSKNKQITMGAFNAYYDIVTLKPFFDKHWNGRTYLYLDDKKKFIHGKYTLLLDGVEYTIKFEDYWLFNRNMSINKWSKHFGGDGKDEFDYDKWGPVTRKGDRLYYKNHRGEETSSSFYDELEYLMNDVLILPKIRQYIKDFKEKGIKVAKVDESLASHIKAKPGITAAGFSKYITSLRMNKNFDDIFRPSISEDIYRFYDRSFMGGYTVGNKDVYKVDLGDKNYKIIGIDMNSMYPYIISKGIPIGRLTKKKNPGYMEFVVIRTKDLKIKDKYAFLSDWPIKQELLDGKLWVCSKYFYKKIQELFETEICIISTLYGQPNTQIASMVEDLYKERKNSDKLTAYTIKILLNSLYGKTCEKTREKHYELNEEGLKKIIEDNPDFRGILPGIYITNTARAILIDAIITTVNDGNIFVYGDTDSVMFLEKKPCSLSIGNNLGQWKIEGKYNYFSRPLVKKKYILEGINSEGKEGFKTAVSGFDKKIVEENMTKEQRRLLFDKDVNVLWRRAKNHSSLNSLSQVIIDSIDVETNETIPITHEMVFVNGKVELIKCENKQ